MKEIDPTGEMLEARGVYRRWLQENFGKLTLAGLAPDDQPLLLRQIYVPLQLTPERVADSVAEEKIHQGGLQIEEWLADVEAKPLRGRGWESPARPWLAEGTLAATEPSRLWLIAEGPGSGKTAMSMEKWLAEGVIVATEPPRLSLVSGDPGSGKTTMSMAKWFVEEALAATEPSRLLLISGEPGSGKTTLTQAMVSSLAGEQRDSFNEKFAGYLPVPIVLRSLSPQVLDSVEAMVDFLFKQVENGRFSDKLRLFLDRGWAILCFDGIDEIISLEQRRRLLKAIKNHRWLAGESANLALLTGRPSGFEGLETKELPKGPRLHVAPFSHGQIRTFLENWFALRPMRTGEEKSVVESLFARLTSKEEASRLLPMARRPAYLAAICFVHGTRGQLPHTRAELYQLLIDAYLEVLDQHKDLARPKPGDEARNGESEKEEAQLARARNWNRQDKLQVLSRMAFQAHLRATSEKKQGGGPTSFEWSFNQLVEDVRDAISFGEGRLRELKEEHAEELAKYFVARTGLIAEVRAGIYQFAHLSFQEFLAAIFLLARANAADNKGDFLEKELLGRLSQGGWHEVAMLLMAVDDLQTQNAGHARVLARLDLKEDSHFELLVRFLAGDEIKLSAKERQFWIFSWFLATCRPVSWPSRSADGRVVGNPSNHADFARAWYRTVQAAKEGKTLVASFGELQSELPWGSSHFATALGICLPILRKNFPADFETHLLSLLDRSILFYTGPGRDGLGAESDYYWAVQSWIWESEALVEPFARAVPLARLFYYPPIVELTALRISPQVPTGKWRQKLARLASGLEGLFCALRLALGPTCQPDQDFRDWQAHARGPLPSPLPYAAFTWIRARARTLTRDLGYLRERSGNRAADSANHPAKELAGALELFAEVTNYLNLPRLAFSSELFWVTARSEEASELIDLTAKLLGGLASASLVVEVMDRQGQTRFSRSELGRAFAPLRDPEGTAAFIEEPGERQLAIEDHHEFLRCPWSPMPLLDAIFGAKPTFLERALGKAPKPPEWEEIDLSPGAIVESYLARVSPIITVIEERMASGQVKEK